MGQLLEAGNVDQVKYYLDLFEQAFLIKLVFKYSTTLKSRTSSPKILIKAPVLSSLFLNHVTEEYQGRVFESIVGCRLLESFEQVFYWAEGNHEVDFVIVFNKVVYAVEVKLQNRFSKSLDVFRKIFTQSKSIIIHSDNYLQFEKNPQKFITSYSV